MAVRSVGRLVGDGARATDELHVERSVGGVGPLDAREMGLATGLRWALIAWRDDVPRLSYCPDHLQVLAKGESRLSSRATVVQGNSRQPRVATLGNEARSACKACRTQDRAENGNGVRWRSRMPKRMAAQWHVAMMSEAGRQSWFRLGRFLERHTRGSVVRRSIATSRRGQRENGTAKRPATRQGSGPSPGSRPARGPSARQCWCAPSSCRAAAVSASRSSGGASSWIRYSNSSRNCCRWMPQVAANFASSCGSSKSSRRSRIM